MKIIEDLIEIEFTKTHPTKLFIPLMIPKGVYKDVEIIIQTREGITLKNSIDVGDDLNRTFISSNSYTKGGSYWAVMTHTNMSGQHQKNYTVEFLPNFNGIKIMIPSLNTNEGKGVKVEVEIQKWIPSLKQESFANIKLKWRNSNEQKYSIKQEVHPKAANVLLIDAYSQDRLSDYINKFQKISNHTINISECVNVNSFVASENNIKRVRPDTLHLITDVSSSIEIGNDKIDFTTFFEMLDKYEIKLLFIDTCNSVALLNSFRNSKIKALVAASENLYIKYAESFSTFFYTQLGEGKFISDAFQIAQDEAEKNDAMKNETFSQIYGPMFLDIKENFRFEIE